MLTGHADSRIDSNAFGPNPNITVFEWLNRLPEFHNRVAVFGTWNTFNDIFNQKRSGIVVHAGWEQPQEITHTPREQLFNQLYRDLPRSFDDVSYDAFLQIQLLDYLQISHPRVLFVGYGETDEWAHSGRYDLVLRSANKFDYFVEQLWNIMQSIPDYRDCTTLILTTDHGRGKRPGGMAKPRSKAERLAEYLDCCDGTRYARAGGAHAYVPCGAGPDCLHDCRAP
jgi:hypothetical protein